MFIKFRQYLPRNKCNYGIIKLYYFIFVGANCIQVVSDIVCNEFESKTQKNLGMKLTNMNLKQ